jgi:alpha-L-fucosidase
MNTTYDSPVFYGSKPVAPYAKNAIRYTQSKDGRVIYAIYLAGESESRPPAAITLEGMQLRAGSTISLLGTTHRALSWRNAGGAAIVSIPESVRTNPPCRYAWVLKLVVP